MKTPILFALLTSAVVGTPAFAEAPAAQSTPKAAPVTAPHNHMTEKSGIPAPKRDNTVVDKPELQKRHIHPRDAK